MGRPSTFATKINIISVIPNATKVRAYFRGMVLAMVLWTNSATHSRKFCKRVGFSTESLRTLKRASVKTMIQVSRITKMMDKSRRKPPTVMIGA
ncbi:hypothetical protein D3C81_1626930 [compost metagenome]